MLKRIKIILKALRIYINDFIRDIKFSTLVKGTKSSPEALLSSLVVEAHTIEKGLTMPEKRANFGHAKLHEILNDVVSYRSNFNKPDERFDDVVGILLEYRRWHLEQGIAISDDKLSVALDHLANDCPNIKPLSQHYAVSRKEFFGKSHDDFKSFSASRHSCRNLSTKVDLSVLRQALELAQNAPSTCNRQSTRVHVLPTSQDLLKLQHGNRGFGHLVDTFLLVTSSLSAWPGMHQRNAPYVDGGIYLMNLLYALHYYGIGACTLNMYLDEERTKHLHNDLQIPEDEVPIALVAIGIPPEEFDLAHSSRRTIDDIVTFH